MGGFLQMTLMTMMNSIIEINSSSDSDEEKEQAGGGFVYHKGTDCKLRGAVPTYSAIEPGDELIHDPPVEIQIARHPPKNLPVGSSGPCATLRNQ